MKTGPKPKPISERFWPMVNKHGPILVPHLGCCWIWTGATMRRGAGKFRMNDPRRLVAASRVAFFLANEYWPTNACHHCDNPPCVRPSHLFDGTDEENMQDASRKGRLENTRPWMIGELASSHKLTAAQVLEIRERRKRGELLGAIAASYQVSYQNIQRIVSRDSWKHI